MPGDEVEKSGGATGGCAFKVPLSDGYSLGDVWEALLEGGACQAVEQQITLNLCVGINAQRQVELEIIICGGSLDKDVVVN
jgi:hypothetical protein